MEDGENLQEEAPKPIELEEVHGQQLGHDGNDDTAHSKDVDLRPLQADVDADQNPIGVFITGRFIGLCRFVTGIAAEEV